jgi:hypothetical protein
LSNNTNRLMMALLVSGCTDWTFDPFPLFIYFLIHSPVPSFRLSAAPFCYLSRKNLYGKKMDEEVRSFPRLQVHWTCRQRSSGSSNDFL